MARILIVEDNPYNARLATFVLGKAGHSVTVTATAEEGLREARKGRPDLILMDMQLPGMDGLQATRRLRADAATASIKVLALTAFAMKGDEQKMIDAGCDSYLAKPYAYTELLALVDELLAPP